MILLSFNEKASNEQLTLHLLLKVTMNIETYIEFSQYLLTRRRSYSIFHGPFPINIDL